MYVKHDGTLADQELVDFFRTRNSQLRKFLLGKVFSPETAEELAQETYVRFLRQPNRSHIADLNAFLFTIAANLARDHLRVLRRGHLGNCEELDEEWPDSRPNTHELIEGLCLAERMERAIDTLPEKTREIFLQYRADGLRYREIAENLGLSERTVEYHIRQALQHCRRYLTS